MYNFNWLQKHDTCNKEVSRKHAVPQGIHTFNNDIVTVVTFFSNTFHNDIVAALTFFITLFSLLSIAAIFFKHEISKVNQCNIFSHNFVRVTNV